MKTTPSASQPRTWKPVTAGILSIIAGVFNMVMGIILIAVSRNDMFDYPRRFRDYMGFERIGTALGVIIIILAIMAIVGGVFALLRRIWGLALAGAICSLLPHAAIILGIPALIFVSISKNEFDHIVTGSPSPPPSA
jgi:hypothetical protein